MRAVQLVVFALVFFFSIEAVYGQCTCQGTYYYKDNDGDGFAANWQSDDRRIAYEEFEASGCRFGLAGNVFYSCALAFNGYIINSQEDCNDNDASATIDQTWYLDADGDGVGGSTSQRSCGSPGSQWVLTRGDECDADSTRTTQQLYYRDADGDGFGNSSISMRACQQPTGYVSSNDDLDDSDPSITNIALTWYEDSDSDTLGNPNSSRQAASQPTGYVANDLDCDDTNASIGLEQIWYEDADGDGFGGDTTTTSCIMPSGYVANSNDLDDSNPAITDITQQNYYQDADGDGFGNPNEYVLASSPPSGYVSNNEDCNDSDASQRPGAIWYLDSDSDGYGVSTDSQTSCTRPSGYVSNRNDRDDSTALITDVAPRNFYQDADGDGYGNPSVAVFQSHPPGGYVVNSADCDDGNALLHDNTLWALDEDGDGFGYNEGLLTQTNTDRGTPEASTPPSGISLLVYGCDNPSTLQYTYVNNSTDYDDQNLLISDQRPLMYYPDVDEDGFGVASNTLFQSAPPTNTDLNYASQSGDCNDQDASIHPNTVWYADSDGDGWGNPNQSQTQCLSPTAYVFNSEDFDDTTTHISNIQPFRSYIDADGDGFGAAETSLFYSYLPPGYVRNDQDCNDQDARLHPNTIWYADTDGDGWGGTSSSTQCLAPTGYVSNTADFDDSTDRISNNAPLLFYLDADGDRYGTPSTTLFYSPEFRPSNYVNNNLDCDDTDPLRNPQSVWYADFDTDGLGDPVNTLASCLQPQDYVDNYQDLNDGSIYITNIATITFYLDGDGDGYGDPNIAEGFSFAPPNYYPVGEDCNDADARIHPQTRWYPDTDGDGFGNRAAPFIGCVPPIDYVLDASDFDDSNPLITDIPARTFYLDSDGDGYGTDGESRYQSVNPNPGLYVLIAGDCDDSNPDLNPATYWYTDQDGDGYGSGVAYQACLGGSGVSRSPGDLDDSNPRITNRPAADYYPDRDGDGDGDAAGTPIASSYSVPGYAPNSRDCDDTDPNRHHRSYWYADADGDGYGDPQNVRQQCSPPSGYVNNGWDYDDSTSEITNISPQTFYFDGDGDGYGSTDNTYFSSFIRPQYSVEGGDCDDENPLIHPETLWYLDADGDGFGGSTSRMQCLAPVSYVLERNDWDDNEVCITDVFPQGYYRDADQDGYGDPAIGVECSELPEGYVVNDDDCDDTEASRKPTTIWYPDSDGDGFGSDEGATITQCEAPFGYALLPGDCNDEDATRLPGLAGVIDVLGLSLEEQSSLSDCAAPLKEQLEEVNDLLADTDELKIYADHDQDGFGDVAEAYFLYEIEGLDFNISLNGDDACPEFFGLNFGCPQAPRAYSEPDAKTYQWHLWFSPPLTEQEKEEEAKKVSQVEWVEIEVYPNPTDRMLTANWGSDVGELIIQVVLLGYHHQTTYEVPFNSQSQSIQVDLGGFPNDLYFLQFYLADGRGITKKIIKK